MATLAGSTIAATYAYLLKMDATSGVTSSLVAVQDGDATDSALQISTTSAAVVHTVTTSDAGSKALFIDANTSGVAAQDSTGMHIDFDRTVAGSGTAAHNDIGINLDVNSASLGTSTLVGMDIDVTGASSGSSTATGVNIAVGSADTNYALITSGGNVGIGVADPSEELEVKASGDCAIIINTSTASNDAQLKFATGDSEDWMVYVDGSATNDPLIFYDAHGTAGNRLILDTNSRISLGNNDTSAVISTTIFGYLAGQDIASGATHNTYYGSYAGSENTDGDQNTYIGANAGKGVNGNANSGNTAVGNDAMLAVTDGGNNTTVGLSSGQALTTGDQNVFIGSSAGYSTQDVDYAVCIGNNAAIGVMDSDANGTIAIGYSALRNLTSGGGNIAIGHQALLGHTTGARNIALGWKAMDDTDANDCPTSVDNVMIGYDAGGGTWANNDSNSNVGVGNYVMDAAMDGALNNTAVGHLGLSALTTGGANTAVGANAGDALLGGGNNVMMGIHAGGSATTVNKAVLIGYYAGGRAAMTGGVDADGTICIGADSGASLTEGQFNTIVGYESGYALVDGDANVLMGYQAGDSLTSSGHNVIIGYQSMTTATSGTDSCVAIGYQAMNGGHTTANLDDVVAIGKLAAGGGTLTAGAEGTVAIGREALENLTSGAGNVAVGYFALTTMTTGAGNVAVGRNALLEEQTGGNNTALGDNAMGLTLAGTECNHNTAVGNLAGGGDWVTAASGGNTAVGSGAMNGALNNADNNTIIGYAANPSSVGAQNQSVIGKGATGLADNSVTLGNGDVTAVYMADDGDAVVYCGGINMSLNQPAAASGSMTSEHLDAYEEGTWTPVFNGHTGSAGTAATTSTSATYTKIGRLVTLQCAGVSPSNWPGSYTGNLGLGGLPFTAAGTESFVPVAFYETWNHDGSMTQLSYNPAAGGTGGGFRESFDNASGAYVAVGDISTSTSIGFAFSYIAA